MTPSDRFTHRRILIIGDDRSARYCLRKILAGDRGNGGALEGGQALAGAAPAPPPAPGGFEIESAAQGTEGCRKVQEACEAGRSFALAFVDARISPGWDGV
jgi:hypothetical protein